MTGEKYLSLVKKASLEAGAAIMEVYESADFEVDQKKDDSPLTLADRKAHECIVAHLKTTDLPILSEEGKQLSYEERKNWDTFWMVDPLDGTKEFIKKNGEFTVNIALIHQGKAVLGVVSAPVLKELYYGMAGKGAFLETEGNSPIALAIENTEVKQIVASRSHLNEDTKAFMEKYPTANTVSMGSSLKFMLVVKNEAQIYPRFAPTMEWDTAAAQAIVEAAGGEVLRYPELEPLQYNREDLLNPYFLVKSKSLKI